MKRCLKWVTSGCAALLLAALWAVVPAANASQIEPALSDDCGGQKVFCLPDDGALLGLHVVQDSRFRMIPLTNNDLRHLPSITVDGYLNGIVLLSKTPLHISIDNQRITPLQHDADGMLELNYYGFAEQSDFWNRYLAVAKEAGGGAPLQSGYSRFPKIPGDALSHAREVRIAITRNGIENGLTIRQKVPVKLDTGGPDIDGRNALGVYYLGNDTARFASAPADFRRRIRAVMEGIEAVEAAMGDTVVHRINLIDLEGMREAYTCYGESEIWLYTPLFWNEPVEELRSVAEHESMHILADRLGLPTNWRLRGLYADLMGFGPLSRERFSVMTTGRPPRVPATGQVAPGASHLFDFINETNFIRGMKGGHAQDDLDEFCASFLHTLLYIDRLGPLLDQPILSRDGSLRHLAADERRRLLADYHTVLNAMAGEIPAPRAGMALRAVFQTGLDAAAVIGSSLEASRTSADPRQDS